MDFSTRIQSFKQEFESQIRLFTVNEITHYQIPTNYEHSEEYMKEKHEKFMEKIKNPIIDQKTDFYCDKIRRSFYKVIYNEDRLLDMAQEMIENAKFRASIIEKRILYPNITEKYLNEISLLYKSYSNHLTQCQTAKLQLENKEHRLDNEMMLKFMDYTILNHLRSNDINNLLTLFKNFPLIRRKEIISIANERLLEDLNSTDAEIPHRVSKDFILLNELQRLANINKLDFDIEYHDGQHFTYQVDKKFAQVSRDFIDFKQTPPKYEYSLSLKDIVNNSMTANEKINDFVLSAFQSSISEAHKYFSEVFRAYSSKNLDRDRLSSFIKLQIITNKKFMNGIVKSLRAIHKIKKEIDGTDNYFDEHFSLIRNQLLYIISISINNERDVDYNRILEIYLDKENQYQKAKFRLISSLFEIKKQTRSINYDMKVLFQIRPSLLFGPFTNFINPFQLAIDEMKLYADSIRSLMTYQIMKERQLSNQFLPFFLWGEFGQVGDDFQFYPESTPISPFETFQSLSIIPNILTIASNVSKEFCDSLGVRKLKFEGYFKFAVMKQFFKETSNYLISFPLLLRPSQSILDLLSCRYLEDIEFLHNEVEKQPLDCKESYLLQKQDLLFYGWELRKEIMKTSILLPVYLQQKHEMMNNDLSDTDNNLNFVQGSFNINDIQNLKELVNNQHSFNLILKIAIRFNNFRSDALFLESSNVFITKTAKISSQTATEMMYYEKFDSTKFSHLFCSTSHFVSWNDKKKLCETFIPFSIRSEMALITNKERSFLYQYECQDVFDIEDTGSILDQSNNLSHFFVPSISQSLTLTRNSEVLKDVLKFVTLRFQLMNYIRLQSYLSHNRVKTLNSIYTETMNWNSPYFSKLKIDLQKVANKDDLSFSVAYFEKEKLIHICKQKITLVHLLEQIFQEKVNVTEESLKKVWKRLDLMEDRYLPTFLNQFYYNCTDIFRTEYLNMQSIIEVKIEDAVVKAPLESRSEVMNNYIFSYYKKMILKFYLMSLMNNRHYEEINRANCIMLSGEEYEGIFNEFELEIEMKAMASLGSISHKDNIEIEYISKQNEILEAEIAKRVTEQQEIKLYKMLDKMLEECHEVFSAPNSSLKPEIYSKRKSINPSHQPCLVTPSELSKQFNSEVAFVQSKFCYKLMDLFKFTSDIINVDVDDLTTRLKSVSQLLNCFINSSSAKLLKSWKGHIVNWQHENNNTIDLNGMLNSFVCYIKWQSQMYLNSLSLLLLREKYLRLNYLHEEQRYRIRDQEKYEKVIVRRISAEFDLLLRDLQNQIRNEKKRFGRIHDSMISAGINAISRFLNNSKFFDCIQMPVAELAKKHLENYSPPKIVLDTTAIDFDDDTDEEEEEEDNFNPIKPIQEPKQPKASLNPRKYTKEDKQMMKKMEEIMIEQQSIESQKILAKSVKDKIEETKQEIDKIKTTCKMQRIMTTLKGIMIRSTKTYQINRVIKDRKSISASLWCGKRIHEEDMTKFEKSLDEQYTCLSHAENDIERLRDDLCEVVKVTTQLNHWRETSLRSSERMQRELKKLVTVGDVNITKLLKLISDKQDELERLKDETFELEQEINVEVREPMQKVDKMTKNIRVRRIENANQRKKITDYRRISPQVKQKISKLLKENKEIREENEEMKEEIKLMEEEIKKFNPSQLEDMKNIFTSGAVVERSFSTKAKLRIVRPEAQQRAAFIPRPNSMRIEDI